MKKLTFTTFFFAIFMLAAFSSQNMALELSVPAVFAESDDSVSKSQEYEISKAEEDSGSKAEEDSGSKAEEDSGSKAEEVSYSCECPPGVACECPDGNPGKTFGAPTAAGPSQYRSF